MEHRFADLTSSDVSVLVTAFHHSVIVMVNQIVLMARMNMAVPLVCQQSPYNVCCTGSFLELSR